MKFELTIKNIIILLFFYLIYENVAQLVEQRPWNSGVSNTSNTEVVSSNLTYSTIKPWVEGSNPSIFTTRISFCKLRDLSGLLVFAQRNPSYAV